MAERVVPINNIQLSSYTYAGDPREFSVVRPDADIIAQTEFGISHPIMRITLQQMRATRQEDSTRAWLLQLEHVERIPCEVYISGPPSSDDAWAVATLYKAAETLMGSIPESQVLIKIGVIISSTLNSVDPMSMEDVMERFKHAAKLSIGEDRWEQYHCDELDFGGIRPAETGSGK